MIRTWFSFLGLTAVTAAALLLGADPGFAKGHSSGSGHGSVSHGSFSHGSFSSGAGFSRSYSPAFRSGSIGTVNSAYRNGSWNRAWEGNRSFDHRRGDFDFDHGRNRFFFGFPFLGYGYGYYPWDAVYGYFPDRWYWSDYGTDYADLNPAITAYQSNYYVPPEQTTESPPAGAEEPIPDNAVLIGVRVPPGAEVWVEGQKTSENGAFREFVSPPLPPGKDYVYDVRARWTDPNGQVVDRTRHMTVRAGDRVMANFLANNPAGTSPNP
jgi:uncharacterized protein (TIGR03000 family)